MAAQNTFWVSPEEKINRLIKQLAEAQAESAVRAVEIEALQRQLADCRADAERYRCLRGNFGIAIPDDEGTIIWLPTEIDGAIDKARSHD